MARNDNLPKLPELFEQVLLAYIKKNYLKKGGRDNQWNQRDTEYFSQGIVALNHSFTRNRSGKYRDYFAEPVLRSGYLAYFLPVNAMKAFAILSQHDRLSHVPQKISVADIGCGPLTLSFGLIFHIIAALNSSVGRIEIEIDAFELNKKILDDGIEILQQMLRAWGDTRRLSVRVEKHVGNIFRTRLPQKKYDYILLGNFLNEFEERQTQQELVLSFLNKLAKENAKTLFLEPGSKKFSRDLQALRDVLIAETDFRVLAPCLHQKTCPLNLTAKADWCNFTQKWQAPRFIVDFDELTDLKKEYLLYSYLFMKNNPVAAEIFHTEQDFLAISDKLKAKGRFEVLGCGEAGRIRFIKSNRDESESNSGFDKLTRGIYFTMPDFEPRSDFELNLNSSVKKRDRVILS